MGAARKLDLDRRLEAYFAALRSSTLKEALKRSAGNWQVYAAVTGSALAMVTSASASIIGNGVRSIAPNPNGSARTNKVPLGAFTNAIQLAMARRDPTVGFFKPADAKNAPAAQAQAPVISRNGVVPLDGTENIIQAGEWVSIFGSNLAGETVSSNGGFPTSLGGTRVEINGRPAYLLFVSPGQINLQVPDDGATGTVSVVVTTSAGSATSSVTLSQFAPSFILFDAKHVSGIILRSDHSGAFGGGTYDILGPTGSSLGFPTVAAQVGDTIELYAVGFGPTTPTVLAGKAFSGAAPTNEPLSLYINNVFVKPTFVGLSSAGLYQINLIVPAGVGQGDVPIQATIGGLKTQMGVLFSVQAGFYPGTSLGGTSSTGGFGTGLGFGSGGGGGGGGGGTGGGGGSGGSGGGSGGGSVIPARGIKAYEPRLRFAPDREG